MVEKDAWSKSTLAVNKLGYPCLTYSKALEYINVGFSCLFEVEKQRHVGLPPRYIGQIDIGIRETLDSDLLRYSEELSGIIVCYKHVQCLDTSGCIMDETPFLYFNVNVKYIIFKPQVGAKLRGVVNKVGHGHYGCIVHKCFNASVHKINADPNNTTKKIAKRITNIDVGTEFIFRITRFDIHNDILSIKGKIDDEDFSAIRNQKQEKTPVIDNQESSIEEKKGDKKSPKKKKRHEKSDGEAIVLQIANNVHQTISIMQNRKKVKKEPESNEEETEKEKTKKSKRKHSAISQSVTVNKEVDEVLNDSERLIPKKKRKKNKIG